LVIRGTAVQLSYAVRRRLIGQAQRRHLKQPQREYGIGEREVEVAAPLVPRAVIQRADDGKGRE
jgi:hypothetical protein